MVSSFAKGILNSEITAWLFSDYAFFPLQLSIWCFNSCSNVKGNIFRIEDARDCSIAKQILDSFCKIFFLVKELFLKKQRQPLTQKEHF